MELKRMSPAGNHTQAERKMEKTLYDENARLLKALAHPTRLHLVDLIRRKKPCVRVMEEVLGIAQPNISQHLSLLRNIGIVEAERMGNHICYQIKNQTVLKLLDALNNSVLTEDVLWKKRSF